MPGHDGTEPVTRDELLYRRIPVSKGWYDDRNGVSPEAFDPRKSETSGISLFRNKYKTIQEVAKGPSKGGYYVAVLRAGDLMKEGIQIVPRPDPPNVLGHVESPGLTCEDRLTQEAYERKVRLAKLCVRLEGLFLPSTD